MEGPLKTGELRRSGANLLQLTGGGWVEFIRARTRLLNGYRRSADRVTDFRDHIGLTTQSISYFLTPRTHIRSEGVCKF